MTRASLSVGPRRAVILAFILVLLVASCRLISPQTPTAEPTIIPPTDTPMPPPPEPTAVPPTALPEPTAAPGTAVPESAAPTSVPTAVPAPLVQRIEFAPGATWTVVQGSLAAGATDEYVLRALAGQTMVAVASSVDGSVVLEIYGLSDGQPLVRSHMGQTSWQGTLPATQDYSVKVVSTAGATDYRLQVIIPPLAAPTTVPTPAPTAMPRVRRIEFAPGGTSAVVQGSLAAEGIDEYHLRASAGQWMMVNIWSLDNTIVLEIYGVSDGQPLLRSHMRQTSWQGPLPTTQDYGIKAVATGVPTSYTLQVTVVSAVTPSPVPQFRRIQFAPGGTSAVVQGTLAAEGIDEYLVGASAGQWMMARVSSPDDSVVLEIYGVSDGQPLVRSHMRQTFWQGTLPATQDYGVKAVSTGAATSYTLQVTIPERVQYAPGAISAVRQGSLPPRETHEYLLRAMKDQTMTVTITSPGNLVLLEIYGLDDGQPLVRVPLGVTTWTGVLPNTQDYDIKAVSVTDTPITYSIEFTVR